MQKLIFFDVETNGVKEYNSVLSISAIKLIYDNDNKSFKEIDRYNKFYYRNENEAIDEGAIKVNGLTDEIINKKREETYSKYGEYPKTFKEDILAFHQFCDGSEQFIAHNIKFDRQFLPFILKNQFDTMIENVEIVKIPSPYGYSKYKWPKLMECANYYNISLDEDMLHQSMYDVIVMVEVFKKMLENNNSSLMRFIGEYDGR